MTSTRGYKVYQDKDGEPIYKGICVLPNVGEDQEAYRMSAFTGCDLQCENNFPIQTSRACRMCHQPLAIASYNKDLMKRINPNYGKRYITKERFKENGNKK
jgi:hypothetical protein